MMFNKLMWNIVTGFHDFFTFYKGGGGGGSSTTKQELDPTVKPFVEYGLQEAKKLYQQGPADYYGGQTWVDPSAQTNLALTMAQNRALAGNPLNASAQEQMSKTIAGDYLNAGNPYLAQATQAGADVATDQFNKAIQGATSSASSVGRYGSDAHQRLMSDASDNLARNLSNTAGPMAYQNYNAERQNQLNAMYGAPQMAQSDYYDIGQLQNVGGILEDYDKQALQGDIAKHEYEANKQQNLLSNYLAGAYGAPMPMSQTTQQSGGGK
jgi:hypothetical protein